MARAITSDESGSNLTLTLTLTGLRLEPLDQMGLPRTPPAGQALACASQLLLGRAAPTPSERTHPYGAQAMWPPVSNLHEVEPGPRRLRRPQ